MMMVGRSLPFLPGHKPLPLRDILSSSKQTDRQTDVGIRVRSALDQGSQPLLGSADM